MTLNSVSIKENIPYSKHCGVKAPKQIVGD